MLRFQSSPSSFSTNVPVKEAPPGSPTTAPMERVARFHRLLLHVSRIPHKISADKKKFHHSLERSVRPCSPKRGPYGNRLPFPEPYLAYPSGSPVKEPSLQVPLIELPQTEILRFQSSPSFIFQSPRYTSSLPGSPDPSESPLQSADPRTYNVINL